MAMGMGPGGMARGGGANAGMGLMRSMRRNDDSLKDAKLPPGLFRRVLRFATPYKRPLIYAHIIDSGIEGRNAALVVRFALLTAVLALGDAGLSLWQRWVSARIG